MTNKVKYFDSRIHTGVGTWIPDNANTVLPILQRCLVDGFNTQTISTITRVGQTATVTTAANHGYVTNQVLLLSGTGVTEYNGEFTITVTGLATFEITVTGSPGSAATGTCKVAPLGWEAVFTGTNKAVYRSQNVQSPRAYYRFEDPATMAVTRNESNAAASSVTSKVVRVDLYDTMSSVDVGNELQSYGYILRGRGSTSNTVPQNIIIVGDDRSFWVMQECENDTAPKYWQVTFIGDYIELGGLDQWCYGMIARAGVTSTATTMSSNNSSFRPVYLSTFSFGVTYYSLVFARTFNGQYAADWGAITSQGGSGMHMGVQFMTYPNPPDMGVHVFPVYCGSPSSGLRGRMPGIGNVGFVPGTNEGRVLDFWAKSMTGENEWRHYLAFAIMGNGDGSAAFDLTGPWR